MNKASVSLQDKTTSFLKPAQGMLQRKCACGNKTIVGRKCSECAKKKKGLQRKLAIAASNDPLEREADRVADQVMAMSKNSNIGITTQRIQRVSSQPAGMTETAPTSVDRVVSGSGRPLNKVLRQDMEKRFSNDFSKVRVHTGSEAEKSARDVNANAYTAGHNIVFGSGRFAPEMHEGQRLIAHELAHVVQQSSVDKISASLNNEKQVLSPISSWSPEGLSSGKVNLGLPRVLQRQLATPQGQVSGFNGLLDSGNRQAFSHKSGRSRTKRKFQVCSRKLQISPVGSHAYIEAPPLRYAIISPTCPYNIYDNPVTGTGGLKWDMSPDPCGKTPTCVTCHKKPGIYSVESCLARTFNNYPNPSYYRLTGPNSNTFAGTLARACCSGMDKKPKELGWLPGWDHSLPSSHGNAGACPDEPTC